MRRTTFLVAALFTSPAAAADAPTGSYRLSADFGESTFTAFLGVAAKKNQPAGQFLGGLDLDPQFKPTVRDVRVNGDRLRFTIVIAGTQTMSFDGKLPAGHGPIPGSLTAGEALVPVMLEPSALTKYDRTELLKEIVAS